LEDLFLLALNRGQLEFVKLFLDNDFSVSNAFRNRQALPLLYLRAMKQVNPLIQPNSVVHFCLF